MRKKRIEKIKIKMKIKIYTLVYFYVKKTFCYFHTEIILLHTEASIEKK